MSSYVDTSFASMTLAQQRDALRTGISNMNDETMWGLIRFNVYHQNSGRGTA
eukprot:CAMPEP_0195148538 /NCGR_PEP_ID=MMETSP0448-20130528/175447_1 /TAXON_ID=66468 /ORGANISM="Heterocapsa triquestra, Strain CCMP 448" /LENGTH=51 /DNA_ID=CAMNT_0040187153 /DNA_START=6 /DNA_END=158 /DNA_ORIENTATION=-